MQKKYMNVNESRRELKRIIQMRDRDAWILAQEWLRHKIKNYT